MTEIILITYEYWNVPDFPQWLKHKDSFGKEFFLNDTCSTFDKDTIQCIFEQLSYFEPKLDYQFDDKYTRSKV